MNGVRLLHESQHCSESVLWKIPSLVCAICFFWFIQTSMCCFTFFPSALASILRAWLDQCPEDFQEPPSYPSLHRVLGFLQKAMPGSEPMRRAQSLLEQLRVQASLENESEGKSYPD